MEASARDRDLAETLVVQMGEKTSDEDVIYVFPANVRTKKGREPLQLVAVGPQRVR